MEQIIMCTPCMSNYYLYDFFVKIIGIEKNLEESDGADDDVYILYVKRYVIRTYSRLKI